MSFTWNPRLVKTPTPIMSAMTIAVAVAVDTVARFELPILAGIIRLLVTWEPAYRCRPLCPQAGKRFPGEKNSTQAERELSRFRDRRARSCVCVNRSSSSPRSSWPTFLRSAQLQSGAQSATDRRHIWEFLSLSLLSGNLHIERCSAQNAVTRAVPQFYYFIGRAGGQMRLIAAYGCTMW